jgi:serine phosphatase RsbU (regulator of sigma subunit)
VNIGLAAPSPAAPGHLTLAPGDTVAVFTDGLYEATGTDLEDGLERLRRLGGEAGPSHDPDGLCDL